METIEPLENECFQVICAQYSIRDANHLKNSVIKIDWIVNIKCDGNTKLKICLKIEATIKMKKMLQAFEAKQKLVKLT